MASPTSHDLYGVAAGTLLVAVGASGTIITSVDEINWQIRASGTSALLTAVAYDALRYVAVGDQGTILTSTDGITWTPQQSGTTQRLNAIATYYDGTSARYLAAGEHGTVCFSPDSVNWTVANVGTDVSLRAAAAFSKVFVTGGQGGAVYSSPDGSIFTAFNLGTSATIEALLPNGVYGTELLVLGDSGLAGRLDNFGSASPLVWRPGQIGTYNLRAAGERYVYQLIPQITYVGTGGAILSGESTNGTTSVPGGFVGQVGGGIDFLGVAGNAIGVVAVGTGGAIWRGSESPAGSIALPAFPPFVGQSVTLQAPAAATGALQWYFNGVPIAGANQATLGFTNAQISQSGTYEVSSNAGGAVDSYNTQLSIFTVAGYSPNLVDPTYNQQNAIPPSATGLPSALPLSDGSVLVNGALRFNPDGTVNTAFSAAFASAVNGLRRYSEPYFVLKALAQPDGKIVFEGGFLGDVTVLNPFRLNADGSLDPSFHQDLSTFSPALTLMPDGRFLSFTATATTLSWKWLLSTGAVDQSNAGSQMPLGHSFYAVYGPPSVISAVDPAGKVVVAVSNQGVTGTSNPSLTQTAFFRLGPDGSIDSTFAQGSYLPSLAVLQLVPTGDKIVYAAEGTWNRDIRGTLGQVIGRLNGDGTLDAGWPAAQLPGPTGSALATLQLDGTAIVAVPIASDLSASAVRLERILTNGQMDRNYSGTLVGDPRLPTTPGNASEFGSLLALPNGELLVQGSFNSLNDVPTPRQTARLTPDLQFAATRLVNISVRSTIASASLPLTVGFVAGGTGTKKALIRGIGPALTAFGVPNALADPQLTLFASSNPIASNDNWSDSPNAAAIAALANTLQAFPLSPGSKDSAMIASVASGLYTTQVTGHGGTGDALAEVYDADAPPADFTVNRVVNFSAQAQVGPNLSLIAGFVVSGSDAIRLLVRAVGPGLAQYGVPGVLPDPVLTIYRGSSVVGGNDNWSTGPVSDPTGALAQAAAAATGAFALTSGSLDAATVLTLPPGAYTAVVTGNGSSSGTALVEVYEVP